MKICLGTRFQNDAHWLNLHTRYMRPAVDGLVTVDGGSTDGGAKIVRSLKGKVVNRAFDFDFGAQTNALLDAARAEGYDAMILCDPDECFRVEDIARIRKWLDEGWDGVRVHLLHFVEDRQHVSTQWVNDDQVRVYRLTPELHYVNKLHEQPVGIGPRVVMSDVQVYHYGVIESLEMRSLTWANYDRVAHDLAPYTEYDELPSAARMVAYPPHIPYSGIQPFDPAVIGLRAPFED